MSTAFEGLAAGVHDAGVSDWPGEIALYTNLAQEAGGSVLDIACGAGRIAVQLADAGARVTGIDLSPEMLAIAREKSHGTAGIRWVQGDMASFELAEKFRLALVPGHSFQLLESSERQIACLECIRRHLEPGGRLVLHIDNPGIDWLGRITTGGRGLMEHVSDTTDPQSGRDIRKWQAWEYSPGRQIAQVVSLYEELDEGGEVASRQYTGPTRLRVIYRFEMEHLLRRAGLEIEALYGDFAESEFEDGSTDMVWIARAP